MDSDVAGSLKLQMDTFMSEHNSIRLSDFVYQLEFYTFKTRRPPTTIKVHEIRHPAHVVPFLRIALHRNLAKISCLKNTFTTLQIVIQDHYTHDDEERAISYLLHKYSDFIDRRRGSVPGSPYTSSGVLLGSTLMAVLDQERDDVTMTRAEEEEEKMEAVQRMFKQEVQALVQGGGGDKSAEHAAQAERAAEALKGYEDQTRKLRQQNQNLVTQLAAHQSELKKSRQEAAAKAEEAAALAANQDELKKSREEAAAKAEEATAALATTQDELKQVRERLSSLEEVAALKEDAAAEVAASEEGSAEQQTPTGSADEGNAEEDSPAGSADEGDASSASELEELVPQSAP
eukprot:COSAG02_NODE_7157_length_3137_cov_1.833169_3_plen_346_part_00